MTERFGVNTGLMRGDPVSTAVFNIVLETVIRKSGLQTEKPIRTKSHQCIDYADEVVIMTRNKTEL